MNHPFFGNRSTNGVIAMAHRGFHGPSPDGSLIVENTMRAFERAVDLGFRYLESDLHVTKDGVAVLIHDPDLARVAGQATAIADLTWKELSTRRLIDGQHVPRLDEILSSWPDIHLNLDAKVPGVVEPAARAIRIHRAETRICMGSFSHRSVLSVRAHLPGSAHSASPREVLAWRMARQSGAFHAYMVPLRSGPVPLVTERSIASARAHGREVHVWTVNEPSEMRRLLALGVDGVMTDRADLLKDVLLSEGRWH